MGGIAKISRPPPAWNTKRAPGFSFFSHSYLFDLLGVSPLVGRNFVQEDAIAIGPDAFGAPNPDLPPGSVILSYGLWNQRFGADPSIGGRTVQMNGWGSVGSTPCTHPPSTELSSSLIGRLVTGPSYLGAAGA